MQERTITETDLILDHIIPFQYICLKVPQLLTAQCFTELSFFKAAFKMSTILSVAQRTLSTALQQCWLCDTHQCFLNLNLILRGLFILYFLKISTFSSRYFIL